MNLLFQFLKDNADKCRKPKIQINQKLRPYIKYNEPIFFPEKNKKHKMKYHKMVANKIFKKKNTIWDVKK